MAAAVHHHTRRPYCFCKPRALEHTATPTPDEEASDTTALGPCLLFF